LFQHEKNDTFMMKVGDPYLFKPWRLSWLKWVYATQFYG